MTKSILKPRNEILDTGQEVVLYYDTNWVGEVRCSGILIKKFANESDTLEEMWEVNPSDNGLNTWWFGCPRDFTKDNNADTEK